MIEKLKSKIKLQVKGKNINRFIKKLTTKKINILSLTYINKNEAKIIIYKEDYEKVLKLKSIYEIKEKDIYGIIKIKKQIKKSKHLIITLIIGYIIFIALTHLIFDIEVIHSNKEIRQLLTEELNQNGIKKYSIKKTYNEIQQIKEKILNKYPDKIEWLEIEEKGTKYIVRTEERKITKVKNENTPRNLVAKKDAVIKKVTASKGDIIKFQNDYVKKGDIIVNGEVMLNEKSMGKVKAQGKVYGEVWYVTKTKYPFAYFEEKETGNKKENYAIKILNKDIELSHKKYKTKKVEEKDIICHPLLPVKLVYQKQKETKVKNQIISFEEATIKAEEASKEKIKKRLKENEYIIRSKYLKSKVTSSAIEVEMFYSVYENITDYAEIREEND